MNKVFIMIILIITSLIIFLSYKSHMSDIEKYYLERIY